MLTNVDAEGLMREAREAQAEGVRLMEAGDWREGSGMGWQGVCKATSALLWEVTGVHNREMLELQSGLSKLWLERGDEYEELVMGWGQFAYFLDLLAHYEGVYDDDLADIVRDEVADYIRRAEELAAGQRGKGGAVH